jgi:hypothetical protein
MKRLILAGLLTLSLAGFAPKANAQPNAFDLVNLARNGYFQEQGIPSHGNLIFAVGFGRVTAEQVVQKLSELSIQTSSIFHKYIFPFLLFVKQLGRSPVIH